VQKRLGQTTFKELNFTDTNTCNHVHIQRGRASSNGHADAHCPGLDRQRILL